MGYQTKVYRKQGGDELVIADGGKITIQSGGTIALETGGALTDPNILHTLRARVTVAQVNAGATILEIVATDKCRMVDCKLIAIGGNAATATGVQIKCGTTVLVDAKVGALTQSTVARAGATNVNVIADGASFVAQGAGDNVMIVKDGSDLGTATHIDVIFDYVIEAA